VETLRDRLARLRREGATEKELSEAEKDFSEASAEFAELGKTRKSAVSELLATGEKNKSKPKP
jgi:hypothetical protein